MLVDDDPNIAIALSKAIKLEHVEVIPFTDPLEAINEFNRTQYDLVISDIRMPKMTGFELYRELKTINSDIPIWFMTAFEITKSEISKMFPTLDVGRVIRKPVLAADLREMIRQDIVRINTKNITEPPYAQSASTRAFSNSTSGDEDE